ncbi:MAG TPA: hemagglutinin, partial [Acinetobacter sp.]|nr:hemagglutinin [Acinetobacter sp.]
DVSSEIADLVLSQALKAQGDINLTALAGGVTTNSLKATSAAGKISILANKNISLNSTQTSKAMPAADKDELTTDQSVISGFKGVTLGSIGDGTVNLQSVQVNASQGDILVSSNNGINLKANNDVVITANKGQVKTVNNVLKGQTVSIENSKSDIKIQNTDLSSTVGKLAINSRAGMSTIIDSVLTSKGNTELYAKDLLTLQGVNATSDQHLAVSSGRTVYSNAEYTPATKWIADKVTNLTSKGVTSVTATGNQVLQNTNLTGGAVLLEAGGFIAGQTGLNLNAVGSDLLKNDTKLNSLNGDLTIQTNSNLTIDPKVYSLKAVGDIELVSKTGTLTLKGYGGTAGNGSEQVVKLDTANGGINLEGTKVDIQGSQLTAQKDIKIVSSKDDVLVDGVKNNFSSIQKLNLAQDYSLELDRINKERVKLQSQEYLNDFSNMQKKYQYYNQVLNKYWDRSTLDQSKNENAVLWVNAYNDYHKNYNEFKSKYMVKINYPILGEPPILISLMDGSPFSADYVFSFKYDDDYINDVKRNEIFYKSNLNGSEHAETKLTSKSGNINITSAKGLSISGGNISAQTGQVNLEASGILAEQYKSTTTTETNPQPRILNASIIVDGHTDFYDKGNENDDNYSMRTLVSPTIINGDKGVNIRTVGKNNGDNLVLQGTGIISKNGDVKIESNKSILFDAAVEQSYDRTITTEKKKSWGGLKKKYITTVAENNETNAASVDISAKNISIETKKLDPSVDAKTPDNNIDIYSGRFTAEGGTISINSGGNLNLYTVEESSRSDVDITKKSSFAGIKYNTSKTNATRTQVTEIPATLKADYIGTKSVYDTRLFGTEFEYLIGSTLEAGGKLELIAAKTSITDLLKKEKNSVVWQSMQDKGSITETAQLPSFNGPLLPTFKAAGGLSVQVPISEKDVNKVELRNEILKLANQPGNAYLKELVNRKDVDWQTVLLTQKDWDYKSQGLTGAGAAIIVIIVTIITMGSGTAAAAGAAGGAAASGTTVGLGASMLGAAGVTTTAAGAIVPSALGAMANAAITSLAAQASIGLINNGGDIGKTLKDLGSKDSIKNLAASVVTAGLMSQVGTTLNIKLNDMPRLERLTNNFIQGVGSNIISSSIQGNNLSDNLNAIILSGLTNALHAEVAQGIGENFSPLLKDNPDLFDKVLHKIIHIAAGCAIGSVQKQCEAGAIGAGVGEILAEAMVNDNLNNQTPINELEIKNYGKLLSGIISAYAGYDVNTAANAAETVIENNAFVSAKVKLEGAKRSCTDAGFAYGSSGCKEFLTKKYEMQPALRNALVQSKVSEIIFETLEDVTPIWGNIKAFRDAETKTDYFVAGITVFPIAKWVNSGKKVITLILKDGSEVDAIISSAGTGYRIYVPQVGKDITEQMAKGKTVTSTTFKPGARQTINNIKGVDKSGNNWSVNLIGDGTKMNKAAQVTYIDVSPAGVKTTKMANIPYDSRGLPIFDDIAKFTTPITTHKTESTQFKYASLSLWEAIQKGQINSSQFTSEQLKQIQAGASKIKGYTWHHNAQSGPNNMQLLPEVVHDAVKHIGQDSLKKGVIIK